MKSTLIAIPLFVLRSQETSAFTAPVAFSPSTLSHARSTATQHSAHIDPSIFTDVHQHADAMQSFFSTLTLSDAVDAAGAAAVDPAVPPDSGNGWFGFLEGPIESLLTLIHSGFTAVGLEANSWGLSIIIMTTTIKLLTYPLTSTQLKSTAKMQVIQPQVKELQAKYQSNPEVLNQKIAQIYQSNDVNPLAGCIPSLVQIPIFIGLYRSVLTLAKNDKLNEPFLFLPSLEGPTYGADPAHASEWITKGWVDGVPSLGWENTAAFLAIPIILVISQSFSMKVMAPKDQEQPSYLKFLPLLIGYFSLNVPSALGIYWLVNNIITTVFTVQIRNGLETAAAVTPSAGGGTSVIEPPSTTFTPAPMREKPAGFGVDWGSEGGVKPITPVDAEIVEVDGDDSGDDDTDGMTSEPRKSGGTKKKKRKNKKKRRN